MEAWIVFLALLFIVILSLLEWKQFKEENLKQAPLAESLGFSILENNGEVTGGSFYRSRFHHLGDTDYVRFAMKRQFKGFIEYVYDIRSYYLRDNLGVGPYRRTAVSFKSDDIGFIRFCLSPNNTPSGPFKNYSFEAPEPHVSAQNFTKELISFLEANPDWTIFGHRGWLTAYNTRLFFSRREVVPINAQEFQKYIEKSEQILHSILNVPALLARSNNGMQPTLSTHKPGGQRG